MNKPDKRLFDELRDLSPLLENLWQERDKILPPPPHYLDHLPDEIIANVRLQKPSINPSALPKTPYIKPNARGAWPLAPISLAAASIVLLIATGTWFFGGRSKNPLSCAQFDCLQASEVQEYVQGNLNDFPLDLILDINGTEKALQELILPLSADSTGEVLGPIFMDALQHLDVQEMESLF